MTQGQPQIGPRDHIVIQDVVKRFGSTTVLRGISMTIQRGETAVIIGGSGAGKTTLLRILIGLEKPTSGHVFIDGVDIAPLSDTKMNKVRQKFGMVFQYAALLDSLTVMDNVAFPLREHSKLKAKDVREKVLVGLEMLGLKRADADKFPAELSGGMRKRVGLARALMLEPQILIYDEPTSGLDPHTSRMVDDLIEETRERFGVTSVVISHDMTSTFRIAHRAALLIDGKVVASGSPDDLADPAKNQVSHDFIVASGIAWERLSRVPPPEAAGSRADEITRIRTP
ncbi:MAG: ABC transporter ATP-binding protein [Deltaproteobacteria bacterium]|nr:ABC transporter ATP-binding protein [Deltaproteobacteria bacterium]